VLIDTEEYCGMHDRLSLKEMCSGSHDVFKFWEISDDKWVQNTDINAMATFSKKNNYKPSALSDSLL